jgi:hypothetical protein
MSAPTAAIPGISRGDRIVIRIIGGVFAIGALLFLVAGAVAVIRRLIDPTSLPVGLLAAIPIDTTSLPGIEILSSSGDHIVVTASGLSTGAIAALAIGDGLGALTASVVCGALAYFTWRVTRGQPFHRSLVGVSLATGVTILLGALLSTFIGGFGQMQAANELNPAFDDQLIVGFEFEPLPWLVGFGVMALAVVFQAGTRLQRDTEGLV